MPARSNTGILCVDDQLALQAFENYVVGFLSHGGDDIEVLSADLLWSSSFGFMDPAVWGDLLESVWSAVGIDWLGPRIDLSDTVRLADNSVAAVTIRSNANTVFTLMSQSPATMTLQLELGDWAELDVLAAIRLVVWWYGMRDGSLHKLVERIKAARSGQDAKFVAIWAEALRVPLDNDGAIGRTSVWSRE